MTVLPIAASVTAERSPAARCPRAGPPGRQSRVKSPPTPCLRRQGLATALMTFVSRFVHPRHSQNGPVLTEWDSSAYAGSNDSRTPQLVGLALRAGRERALRQAQTTLRSTR